MYYTPRTLANACWKEFEVWNLQEKYSFLCLVKSRFLNYYKIINFALQTHFLAHYQGFAMRCEFTPRHIFVVRLALACLLLIGAGTVSAQQYYQPYSYPPSYRKYTPSYNTPSYYPPSYSAPSYYTPSYNAPLYSTPSSSYTQPYSTYSQPYSAQYNDEGTYYDAPQTSTSELGLRYLKLANSYREARNVDMAQYYARRGFDLVRGRGSRYWEAVAYEYLGLIYRDMGDNTTALDYLRRAESTYRTVISPLRTESSVNAVQRIMSDVEFGSRYFYSPKALQNYRWNTDSPYYSRYVSPQFSNASAIERERLTRTNTILQARLTELEERLRNIEQPVYYGR